MKNASVGSTARWAPSIIYIDLTFYDWELLPGLLTLICIHAFSFIWKDIIKIRLNWYSAWNKADILGLWQLHILCSPSSNNIVCRRHFQGLYSFRIISFMFKKHRCNMVLFLASRADFSHLLLIIWILVNAFWEMHLGNSPSPSPFPHKIKQKVPQMLWSDI